MPHLKIRNNVRVTSVGRQEGVQSLVNSPDGPKLRNIGISYSQLQKIEIDGNTQMWKTPQKGTVKKTLEEILKRQSSLVNFESSESNGKMATILNLKKGFDTQDKNSSSLGKAHRNEHPIDRQKRKYSESTEVRKALPALFTQMSLKNLPPVDLINGTSRSTYRPLSRQSTDVSIEIVQPAIRNIMDIISPRDSSSTKKSLHPVNKEERNIAAKKPIKAVQFNFSPSQTQKFLPHARNSLPDIGYQFSRDSTSQNQKDLPTAFNLHSNARRNTICKAEPSSQMQSYTFQRFNRRNENKHRETSQINFFSSSKARLEQVDEVSCSPKCDESELKPLFESFYRLMEEGDSEILIESAKEGADLCGYFTIDDSPLKSRKRMMSTERPTPKFAGKLQFDFKGKDDKRFIKKVTSFGSYLTNEEHEFSFGSSNSNWNSS